MDNEHTVESAAAEELLNQTIVEGAADATVAGDGGSTREQLVDRYEATALNDPSPLGACLAVVTSGLLRIGLKQADAIEQTLAAEPVTVESVGKIESPLNIYLRVLRQIDRFAQFGVRAEEARKTAAKDKVKRQMFVMQECAKERSNKSPRSIPGEWFGGQ